MAFLFLLIHQLLFILQPLDWSGISFSTDFPVTVAAIFIAFVVLVIQRRMKLFSIQSALLMGFCVTVIISSIFAGWLGGGVARAQFFILSAMLPFLVYSTEMVSQKKHEITVFLFSAYALIMVVNGVSQLGSEQGLGLLGARLSQGTRITFLGFLNDPNDLAGYFLICLPFAFYFITHKQNVILKAFGLVTAISLFYGIFLTNSRGGLLATVVLILTYLIYRYGSIKSIFLGLFLTPAVIFAAASFRTIEMDSSAQGRADAWYAGLQMLESNPLFGVGMGNFIEYNFGLVAHNSFIHVMAELGILGYAFWFSTIALSFVMSFHLLKNYHEYCVINKFKIVERTKLTQALSFNCAIFFSMVGYFSTAFFLSRSYTFFTFVICAFSVASYYRVIQLDPSLAIENLKKVTVRIGGLSLLTILGMYIVVRIILRILS